FVGEDVATAEEGNRRIGTGLRCVEEFLGQRRAIVRKVRLGADKGDGPFETRLACGFDGTQPRQRGTDDDQSLNGHRLFGQWRRIQRSILRASVGQPATASSTDCSSSSVTSSFRRRSLPSSSTSKMFGAIDSQMPNPVHLVKSTLTFMVPLLA